MILGFNGAGEVEGGVPKLFSVRFATAVAFRLCSKEGRCSSSGASNPEASHDGPMVRPREELELGLKIVFRLSWSGNDDIVSGL
jgi:hypothetical protein